MPFANTSVIEIVVLGASASGQQVNNVFHYRDVLAEVFPYTNTNLANGVNAFAANWRAFILPLLSVDYKVLTYRGRALVGVVTNTTPPPDTRFDVGEQFDLTAPVGDVGVKAGTVAPSFTAFGNQKLVDRAGRNFRGSFRLGTIQEIDVSGNLLTVPVHDALQTATTAFVQATLDLAFEGPFWEMCVLSRTLALAAPPPFTDLRSLTAKVLNTKSNTFATSQVSRKQSLTRPT